MIGQSDVFVRRTNSNQRNADELIGVSSCDIRGTGFEALAGIN